MRALVIEDGAQAGQMIHKEPEQQASTDALSGVRRGQLRARALLREPRTPPDGHLPALQRRGRPRRSLLHELRWHHAARRRAGCPGSRRVTRRPSGVGSASCSPTWRTSPGLPSRSTLKRCAPSSPATSRWRAARLPCTAGRSRSSSATRWWRCGARPPPTRTTPSAPHGPRSSSWRRSAASPDPPTANGSPRAPRSRPGRRRSASREGQGMVSGDVVNVAARLQAAAPSGGVVVDDRTEHAIGPSAGIVFTSMGPLQLKGKASAVAAFTATLGARRGGGRGAGHAGRVRRPRR